MQHCLIKKHRFSGSGFNVPGFRGFTPFTEKMNIEHRTSNVEWEKWIFSRFHPETVNSKSQNNPVNPVYIEY
jgi:hypothetical protein